MSRTTGIGTERVEALLRERVDGLGAVLRRGGRAAREALPQDGRALRARGAARGVRRVAGRPLRRAPRRGRVRPPRHRRQARAAGARARRRGRADRAAGRARGRGRGHRDGVRPRAGHPRRAGRGARARLPDDRVHGGLGRGVGVRPRRSIADPLIRQEVAETLYHTLWEHVHIFLDNRGLLEGRAARPVHDSGASSFLYPFLGQQETDLDAILADVKQSILLKADEITRAAHADADGVRRRPRHGGGRAAGELRVRRAAHRARQRRLGDRRDGRRRRLPHADVRRPAAPRAGPHRGHRHHHRGRQRHRDRRDLPAPGHRLRPRGRRAHGAVDERQLAEHPRGAARGSQAQDGDDGVRRLRRRQRRAEQARRPRLHQPLGEHPAHPGSARERLPRAARARRARRIRCAP